MNPKIRVIGAGLAGAEAAIQAADMGVSVELYEMKPKKYTPAHHTPGFAELVCSKSFRSSQLSNAVGVLKRELSMLNSLFMEAAYQTEVPAGCALAVDRERFSAYITDKIRSHPLITVVEEEVVSIPSDGINVIATGPLTADGLASEISSLLGGRELHFFDAAAPIVDFATVNTDIAFFASRYGKGNGDDYLNCPMTREQYDAFYNELIVAKEAEIKEFDREEQKKKLQVFEGCMPVEVMAKRGYDTLCYGPLKPVGLVDPRTNTESFAVVQLRKEN